MASLQVVDHGSSVASVASEAPTPRGHCSLGGFLNPNLCDAQDVGHEDESFALMDPRIAWSRVFKSLHPTSVIRTPTSKLVYEVA